MLSFRGKSRRLKTTTMNRIDALFSRLRGEGRRALMPFVTAADPNLATTAELLPVLLRHGAHMIELGIPYSDPVADGPVITASYTRALRQGVKMADIFEMIRWLRSGWVGQAEESAPLVTMVSYAIVYRQGVDHYLEDAVNSGVDGLIVPDLPVEEAEGLRQKTDARNLKLIQLVTPTTPRDRAVRIANSTTGFLYYVSVAGITGERSALPDELVENVAWLRSRTELPICIGFGISGPEQVRQLAPVADGLIVGSALVRRMAEIGQGRSKEEVLREVGQFMESLAEAAESVPREPIEKHS